MRKRLKAEEVFYNNLISLIKNTLINDPNFINTIQKQSYYEKKGMLHYDLFKEKAKYILEEIENMKHLILWEGDNE